MNRRCVIFAGLPVAPELCEDIGPQDIIITADAGWKTARALGFFPALALGDFDTAPAPEGPDVLRLPAEKDDTDTFFAARRALETGCGEVLILGGIGGRLDHTLANICTLLFLEQHGVCAWLRSETAAVRVLLPGQYGFPAQKDVYVSLFPMNGDVHGLCLRGFRTRCSGRRPRWAPAMNSPRRKGMSASHRAASFTCSAKRTGNPPPCRRARLF